MKQLVYPQYVNVLTDDNKIEEIKYIDLFEHENNIILSNMWLGVKSGCSEEEIMQYQEKAEQEFRKLNKAIRENHDVLLVLNKRTKRYIVYKNDKENENEK